MPTPSSYRAVLNRYNSSTAGVKLYFNQLPGLLTHRFPLEVCLAYLFLRLEKGQNMALYCGVVKLHQSSTGVAYRAISAQHLTRDGFLTLFQTVFGSPLSESSIKLIKTAEKVRDKVIHGKDVADPEMRGALVDVIAYAEAVNAEVRSKGGFEPFGSLQGFKGAGKSLGDQTSRWLLKGLGFALA